MSEELKPCPFCGSENIVMASGINMSGLGNVHITCRSCGCKTTDFFYWEQGKEMATRNATEAWEKRA